MDMYLRQYKEMATHFNKEKVFIFKIYKSNSIVSEAG